MPLASMARTNDASDTFRRANTRRVLLACSSFVANCAWSQCNQYQPKHHSDPLRKWLMLHLVRLQHIPRTATDESIRNNSRVKPNDGSHHRLASRIDKTASRIILAEVLRKTLTKIFRDVHVHRSFYSLVHLSPRELTAQPSFASLLLRQHRKTNGGEIRPLSVGLTCRDAAKRSSRVDDDLNQRSSTKASCPCLRTEGSNQWMG